MSVTFIVNFDVKEECIFEFAEIMTSVKSDLPKVDGCSSVEIYSDTNSPSRYTLVEEWKEKVFHEKHIDSLIKAGSWGHISKLLTAEPAGSYFNKA